MSWKDDNILTDNALPRTAKGQIFQQEINTGMFKQFCTRKSDNDIETSTKKNVDNLVELEPTAASYYDGPTAISFPKFVPYEIKNSCTINRGNFTDEINNKTNNSITTTNPPVTIVETRNTTKNSSSIIAKDEMLYKGATGELYSRYLILDNNGMYHLFWRFDEINVTFEIQAKAKGWVGLGFSPNGGMANADIVHAYADNSGKVYLTDRYATANGFPQKDDRQDYTLLSGSKNDTHLIVMFTRKMYTCDEQDMMLSPEDTLRFIYAWSDSIPANENSFQMHMPTTRGTKSVHLFDPPANVNSMPADVEILNITAKNVLPIIQQGNEMIVHHMILYACADSMARYANKGVPCFDKNEDNFDGYEECQNSFIAGWAVGSDGSDMPNDVGFPVFGDDNTKYVMLEMHYDNSNYLKGKVDSSGLSIAFTKTFRPIESGSMVFGAMVGPQFQILPAGQPEFTHYTYCFKSCTHWFPKEGIKVWQAAPHTHLIGRKIRLHHIRDGVQLDDIYADEHYDFNYQQGFTLAKPKVILPNDEFIVECVYDTSSRNETTYGGHSTRNEMCLMFLNVYPRMQVGEFACVSFPSYSTDEWKTMFNANFDSKNDTFIMSNGSRKTPKDFAKTEVKFPNQNVINQFQKNIKDGAQIGFCQTRSMNSTLANTPIEFDMFIETGPPKITEVHKSPNICAKDDKNGKTTEPSINISSSTTNNNQQNVTNLSISLTSTSNNNQQNVSNQMYTHQAMLDATGLYRLQWLFDDTSVTFKIECAAKGWVALGFSPNGGMADADIVHIFVDSSGTPQFTDRSAKLNGWPVEDTHSDYSLISCVKNNTHIVAVVTRLRNTCDDQDYSLDKSDGTFRVIYAWSNTVPEGKNSFHVHEPATRGTKSIRLFDKPLTFTPLPSDVKNLDVLVSNVAVPEDYDTLYWCQVFPLPQWTKHHVIRIDPKIQKGNEMVVHHMLLYSCPMDMSKFLGKGEPCFDRTGDTVSEMMECQTKLVGVWAVGGESVIYPERIGQPMFEENGDKFLMMEMHYDNSLYLKGKVDSSGLRLYLTPTLRPIESGTLTLASGTSPENLIIPPNQTQFTHYAYCYSDCTKYYPEGGLTVFQGLLHTHLTGRKIYVHHIRNGTQLDDLFADDHYDFNYQALALKTKPVQILPNDELILECVYDTSGRKDITFGGIGTKQEMCMAFIDFYPRPKSGGFACFSQPSYKSQEWKSMFNANYNESGDVFVLSNGSSISPREFAKTQIRFADQNVIDKFQKNVRNGQQIGFCNKNEKNITEAFFLISKTGPPEIKVPLKPTNSCTVGTAATSKSQTQQQMTTMVTVVTKTTVVESAKTTAKPNGGGNGGGGGSSHVKPLPLFSISISCFSIYLYLKTISL